MRALIGRFIQEESGQALVEYGAVIGLVVVGAVAIMVAFRTQLTEMFTRIGSQLNAIPGQ